ncbi:hypothetical protein VUR80DRAFT_882 [Thermomyces stellatus]
MSEYIGSRISLISKSDIRYVGTLHQINSEQSTVSLENVKSFGTEGRKSRPEEEISASDQVYEYIIFRGSDVKDLRIEQQPAKESKPSSVPSDPAILGARPRPEAAQGPNAQAPAPGGPGGPGFSQPGQPQPPFNNDFYGPPGSWGRGGPGPGFGNMPYPPPGWYPPPQGFQPGLGGPGGPAPWNPNFAYPPNMPGAPAPPGQDQNQKSRATPVGTPGAEAKQGPSGPSSGPKQAAPAQPGQPQPPTEPKSLGQGGPKPQAAPETQPAKPPTERAAPQAPSQKVASPVAEPVATKPKNNRVAPAIPAVPKPFPVPPSVSAGAATTTKTSSGGGIQDATEAAKAAVALAMAKMESGNDAANKTAQTQNGATMDNLTKKVDEMRVNAARAGHSGRGRGRGGRGAASKIEVPDVDFDFAESNAKFNKDDLVREAISAASPAAEDANPANGEAGESVTSDKPADQQAYNKSRSFFDNISSEAKERAESGGQKPGGREWRGEEHRKNIETFGQGSVDGGYRNYRGRGRGRGGPRGRGYNRSYRGRGNPASTAAAGQ